MEQSKKGQHHPNAAADKQSTSELSAVPKPKHKHYGHRERMRTRFQKSGLEGFQPHEILELCSEIGINPEKVRIIMEMEGLDGRSEEDVPNRGR